MREPNTPADEDERLEELQSLAILDTKPEERFDRYTRLAKRLFKVPIALVSLVDHDRQWFKSRQGLDAPQTGRNISFCGHAVCGTETFVVENAAVDDRFFDNPLVTGDPHIRFYAGHPLAGPKGGKIGTLCIIDREPRTLSREDIEALQDISDLVSGELSALQMATLDPLTNLSNRRGFELLAHQAVAACRRVGRAATLAMVDMDGFKQINDTFGHDAGDEALVEFSRLMLETFRDSDVVGRPGGDEFLALLTGADQAEANAAMNRLRDAVERRNSATQTSDRLDFSAGVATADVAGSTAFEELLACADADMYSNKRRRRAA